MRCEFTIWTFLGLQYSGVEYVHTIVKWKPKILSSYKAENLHPINNFSFFLPLSILVATVLFSVSTLKYLTQVEPCSTYILVMGLSQSWCALQHMIRSAYISKSGCDCATFVDPFIHGWIFSLGWNSWLLWI